MCRDALAAGATGQGCWSPHHHRHLQVLLSSYFYSSKPLTFVHNSEKNVEFVESLGDAPPRQNLKPNFAFKPSLFQAQRMCWTTQRSHIWTRKVGQSDAVH
jgi:hypothetical protein